MFRFINSGIKQSATTLPNSIYNKPGFNKRGNDDDKENQKLSLISQPKVDQTICIYRRNPGNQILKYFENSYSFLERRNLILEFSHYFGLFKLHPFWLGTISGSIQSSKWVVHKSTGYKSQEKLLSNKQLEIKHDVPEPKHIDNKASASETHKPLVSNKKSETKPINKPNSIIKPVDKLFDEDSGKQVNEMGHELNTKGCDAAEISYHKTAVRYWNAAAQVNYPPSQFNLGVYYESNNDLEEAEKWYRLAIKSGRHPTAAYNLALLLNNKLNDHLKAEIRDLLTISANQGLTEAIKCMEYMKKADETS